MKVPEIHVLVRIPIPGTRGIPIFWYGAMLLVGFLTGMWLARRLARREGVPRETIYDLALWAIVSGLAGARLWYVIENADHFYGRPGEKADLLRDIGRTLNVSDGGLVFYGGIVAPIAVLWWWFRRRRLPALKMFDILAPAAMLGLSFGRIGCFFNGCCFGAVCGDHAPLCVERPQDGPTWTFQERRGVIPETAEWSLPVHPTQLYEWAGALAVCGLLLLHYRRKRHDGDILAWLLILYPVLRTLVEMLREHEAEALIGPVSVAQVMSGGAFVVGVMLLATRRRRPPATPYVPPQPAPADGGDALPSRPKAPGPKTRPAGRRRSPRPRGQ